MMLANAKKLLGFLPAGLVKGVCTCGPIGYWGPAPGTNGTVVGLALYTAIFFPLTLGTELIVILSMALLAVIFCDEGERRLKKRDPGEVIIDEVVAVPLCFIGMKTQMMESGLAWVYLIAGFFIFRAYDIVKPFGINRLQKYPGGLGVVLDDLAAAIATNLTLRVLALAAAHGGWSTIIN
jgi:phosphatidylglycerophosphatase A